MKVFNLTEKQFLELDKLFLPEGITNTQGKLYHLPTDSDEIKLIYKMIFPEDIEYFANKISTISDLIDAQRTFALPELVYPTGLVTIDGEIAGLAMPFIEGTNLKCILKNPDIPYAEKRDYLIQIGQLLEKMKLLRQTTSFNDFYLNDIHEANFIIENTTRRIKFVDLDSCAINGNEVDRSMYLRPLVKFDKLKDKYEQIKGGYFGTFIKPSDNTELYSYLIIILNFIGEENLGLLKDDDFITYLLYLQYLGYPNELLDCFARLYTHQDNINPVNALEKLEYIADSSYQSYQRALRKK